jgi:hypothetical protein
MTIYAKILSQFNVPVCRSRGDGNIYYLLAKEMTCQVSVI